MGSLAIELAITEHNYRSQLAIELAPKVELIVAVQRHDHLNRLQT